MRKPNTINFRHTLDTGVTVEAIGTYNEGDDVWTINSYYGRNDPILAGIDWRDAIKPLGTRTADSTNVYAAASKLLLLAIEIGENA